MQFGSRRTDCSECVSDVYQYQNENGYADLEVVVNPWIVKVFDAVDYRSSSYRQCILSTSWMRRDEAAFQRDGEREAGVLG